MPEDVPVVDDPAPLTLPTDVVPSQEIESPAAMDAPPPPVEPLLGFDTFVQTAGMTRPRQAGLRRWMFLQGIDPHGHYPLAGWRGFLRETLAHH
jgi:hypothetical protein